MIPLHVNKASWKEAALFTDRKNGLTPAPLLTTHDPESKPFNLSVALAFSSTT